MLDTDLIRQFATLTAQKRALEEQAKALASELKAMEQPLMEAMSLAGVETLPIETPEGRMTVYLHSQMWARATDKATACSALRECGLGDFVAENFNTNTVSAHIREAVRNGEDLPQPIRDAFKISEIHSVRARRS